MIRLARKTLYIGVVTHGALPLFGVFEVSFMTILGVQKIVFSTLKVVLELFSFCALLSVLKGPLLVVVFLAHTYTLWYP